MRELDLVSLKKFILSPGIVDFAQGKHNLISPAKKGSGSAKTLAKSVVNNLSVGNAEVDCEPLNNGETANGDTYSNGDLDSKLDSALNGDLSEETNSQVSQIEIDFNESPPLKPKTENEKASESKESSKQEILTLSQAIEAGKEILFQLENDIVYTYEEYFANRGFAYTAKEIIVNFEEYLQALFLTVATTNRDLGEDEMRFIWSVFSRADIFSGMNSIEETLAKALKTVSVLPHAILISVAVDKFYDKTVTAKILSGIYDIYLIMCKLAGILTTKKEKLFAKIKEFAQAQGVKI